MVRFSIFCSMPAETAVDAVCAEKLMVVDMKVSSSEPAAGEGEGDGGVGEGRVQVEGRRLDEPPTELELDETLGAVQGEG